METIIRTILGIFLAIIIIFVAIGSIGAINDATAADAYLQHCSAELQVTNFNDNIIQALQTEAQENGYELRVEVKRDAYGDALYAVIELDYTFKINIIGLESEHTKRLISK